MRKELSLDMRIIIKKRTPILKTFKVESEAGSSMAVVLIKGKRVFEHQTCIGVGVS